MRITELRSRLLDYFSDSDTYSRDTVHAELGGLTINEALARGVEAGVIWKAVIAHNPQMPSKFH